MIPVGISRRIVKMPSGGMWGSLGVYAAYAVSGYEKGVSTSPTTGTVYIYNDINIHSHNSGQILPTNVMPLDIGLHAAIGFTINRFRISAKYFMGLNGVLANPDFYSSQYFNRAAVVALSYQVFNRR